MKPSPAALVSTELRIVCWDGRHHRFVGQVQSRPTSAPLELVGLVARPDMPPDAALVRVSGGAPELWPRGAAPAGWALTDLTAEEERSLAVSDRTTAAPDLPGGELVCRELTRSRETLAVRTPAGTSWRGVRSVVTQSLRSRRVRRNPGQTLKLAAVLDAGHAVAAVRGRLLLIAPGDRAGAFEVRRLWRLRHGGDTEHGMLLRETDTGRESVYRLRDHMRAGKLESRDDSQAEQIPQPSAAGSETLDEGP